MIMVMTSNPEATGSKPVGGILYTGGEGGTFSPFFLLTLHLHLTNAYGSIVGGVTGCGGAGGSAAVLAGKSD